MVHPVQTVVLPAILSAAALASASTANKPPAANNNSNSSSNSSLTNPPAAKTLIPGSASTTLTTLLTPIPNQHQNPDQEKNAEYRAALTATDMPTLTLPHNQAWSAYVQPGATKLCHPCRCGANATANALLDDQRVAHNCRPCQGCEGAVTSGAGATVRLGVADVGMVGKVVCGVVVAVGMGMGMGNLDGLF